MPSENSMYRRKSASARIARFRASKKASASSAATGRVLRRRAVPVFAAAFVAIGLPEFSQGASFPDIALMRSSVGADSATERSERVFERAGQLPSLKGTIPALASAGADLTVPGDRLSVSGLSPLIDEILPPSGRTGLITAFPVEERDFTGAAKFDFALSPTNVGSDPFDPHLARSPKIARAAGVPTFSVSAKDHSPRLAIAEHPTALDMMNMGTRDVSSDEDALADNTPILLSPVRAIELAKLPPGEGDPLSISSVELGRAGPKPDLAPAPRSPAMPAFAAPDIALAQRSLDTAPLALAISVPESDAETMVTSNLEIEADAIGPSEVNPEVLPAVSEMIAPGLSTPASQETRLVPDAVQAPVSAPVPRIDARKFIPTLKGSPALSARTMAGIERSLELEIGDSLGTRIDGKIAGNVEFRQSSRNVEVRVGSLMELLQDRFGANEFAHLTKGIAADEFLSIAQLRKAGVPISYDPVYDEFNIGNSDYRPSAAHKVQIDQISQSQQATRLLEEMDQIASRPIAVD